MADYYLEFSQVLAHLTEEESDWLRQQLEIVHVFGDREVSATNMPDGLDPAQADWSGCRFCRDYEEEIFDPAEPGFCYHFEDQVDAEWGRNLWVYAEEYGDLGPLAHLVQKFLRRFRPKAAWWVTYASTCSKPRLDSFGGGADFVTADGIKFDCSWDFVEREAAAFAERRAA